MPCNQLCHPDDWDCTCKCEDWRAVEGFHGYEINAIGELRSYLHSHSGIRINPRTLRPGKGSHKYIRSCLLSDSGVKKMVYIHRLVAQAFISNPFKKNEVNHKDGNKTNNHLCNLEWCTPEENKAHAKANRLIRSAPIGALNPRAKLSGDQVLKIRYLYGNTALTQKQLGEIFKVSSKTISSIIRRLNWAHI